MTATVFAMWLVAVYLLMQGVPALVRPQAIIAFNAWIARLLKRRPLPQRQSHVRVMGMIETIIGALLLVVIFS